MTDESRRRITPDVCFFQGGFQLNLCTLASGSSGNATLISTKKAFILVDAGISAKRITAGLAQVGQSPSDLSAICITHSHSDHINGLRVFLKRSLCPIYATQQTASAICEQIPDAEGRIRLIHRSDRFNINDLQISSFATSHDAPGSAGFSFYDGDRKCSIVTDLGQVTDEVRENILGSHLALVEANHEPEWVKSSPYPAYLKARILGKQGHLSNDSCAMLCCELAEHGAKKLILGHLSKENNSPEQARSTVEKALTLEGFGNLSVFVAPRQECGLPVEV